jgi:hypothetical protein
VRFKRVTPGRKRRSRRIGGSGSIDERLETGYPQTEWVREKTRKRAPTAAVAHMLSTAVERGVDAEKSLQISVFYIRQGVLRACRDAAMLAAS